VTTPRPQTKETSRRRAKKELAEYAEAETLNDLKVAARTDEKRRTIAARNELVAAAHAWAIAEKRLKELT
jgi:hypothetical protein